MIERFRQEEIMSKVFNTTAVCIPEEHYMVNIAQRLQEIKALVDDRSEEHTSELQSRE